MTWQTTSIPEPQGTCLKCGGTLYKYLAHQCHSTVIIPAKLKEHWK